MSIFEKSPLKCRATSLDPDRVDLLDCPINLFEPFSGCSHELPGFLSNFAGLSDHRAAVPQRLMTRFDKQGDLFGVGHRVRQHELFRCK